MKLQAGQTAVITGAASGIARAVSQALAARGLNVVMADLDGPGVIAAAGELAGALGVRCDITDCAAVERLRDAALDRFGRVDLVCNIAGVTVPFKPTWEHPAADVDWLMAINIRGAMNCVRTFMPLLVDQRSGHFLHTASMAGVSTVAFNAPYNASKTAVVALAETMAMELASLGIPVGVSVLCPGQVQTNNHRSMQKRPSAGGSTAEPVITNRPAESTSHKITAAEAAAFALAGIEADRLHIFTHPNAGDRIRARIDRLLVDVEN